MLQIVNAGLFLLWSENVVLRFNSSIRIAVVMLLLKVPSFWGAWVA